MISFTYNKCRRFLCGIPKIHIQIIPATNWQHIFATNLQPRFRKLQCFRAFPTFFSYSNSSKRKYHQIKNADFMRHSTASVSSNVTLFISFSKTLVANQLQLLNIASTKSMADIIYFYY